MGFSPLNMIKHKPQIQNKDMDVFFHLIMLELKYLYYNGTGKMFNLATL